MKYPYAKFINVKPLRKFLITLHVNLFKPKK